MLRYMRSLEVTATGRTGAMLVPLNQAYTTLTKAAEWHDLHTGWTHRESHGHSAQVKQSKRSPNIFNLSTRSFGEVPRSSQRVEMKYGRNYYVQSFFSSPRDFSVSPIDLEEQAGATLPGILRKALTA
jgi:hypothetical protein